LYKNYSGYGYFNEYSITEQIELLRHRKKISNINNSIQNKQNDVHDSSEDEDHPYYKMSAEKLENIFEIKFVNQYKFTEHEQHIINLVTNHSLIKNKIKSVHWLDKII
jgi:hypothetical protein